MISKYFDVVRAINVPANYLSVGYDVDVIEYKHETIQSDKPSKLVSLEKGDILVGTVKQQVALFVGDFEAYAQQGWKVLRLKDGADIDVIGVFAFMNTVDFARQLKNAYQGESVNNLMPSELVKLDVDLRGPRDKMTKDFMLQIKMRKLVERRIFLIKELKKGMMQRMFPKNGSKIPESRIVGFTDAWVERTFFDNIKNIIDFRGRTPKKLGMDWSDTGYLALSALNVKNGYIDLEADAHYGNQELYDTWMTGNELHKNQVLFTTEAPMGNVAQVPDNKKYILSQRVIAFDVKEDKIAEDFLATILRSPKTFNELSALSSGGTAKGVSQKILARMKIVVPNSLDEQIKIGSSLSLFDKIIDLHQEELLKLKNLKKSYLGKM